MNRQQRGAPSDLPPKMEKAMFDKFQEGMKKISKLQQQKVMECFKSNPDNMSGFAKCFQGFFDKTADISTLTEQRINWCIFKYGECVDEGKLIQFIGVNFYRRE